MRKISWSIILLVCLIVCLNGCKTNQIYNFMQAADSIASIDIIFVEPYMNYKSYNHIEEQWSIATNNWESFLNDFNDISCKRHGMDPYYSTSGTVIRITYADGGYEIISAQAGLHINSKGDWSYTQFYFDKEEFGSLIEKYRTEGTTALAQGTVCVNPNEKEGQGDGSVVPSPSPQNR